MLRSASARCPALYNYLKFAYSGALPNFVGDTVIASTTGTQQGCPLGPIGFALGIQDVVESLTHLRLPVNSWYLDDGIIIGDGATIGTAYALLKERLATRGLAVNPTKCVLWGPSSHVAVANGCGGVSVTPWEPGTGITVLGCPVEHPSSTAFRTATWDAACAKLEVTVDKQVV